MSSNGDLIRAWLLRHGWMKDSRRHGLVSPAGTFVSERDLEEGSSPTAGDVKAMQDAHNKMMTANIEKIMRGGVSGPPSLRDTRKDRFDHLTDAMAYGVADSFQFPPNTNTWTPYDKLKMRLGMAKSDTFGLDHVHIVEGKQKVFVFLVQGDKALILDDDPALFPSDTIIAQYRLFKEAVS